MYISRRRFLSMLAASTTLTLPSRASNAVDRKFLFICNEGGWDSFCTYTPVFDSPYVDLEPDAWPGQYGNIPVVEHPERNTFSRFMQDFGDRLCVINGIESRSITHQRCMQLILTGSGNNNVDDWPTILAANTEGSYPMPHVIFRGPGYATNYSHVVIRVGENGQFTQLLQPSELIPTVDTTQQLDDWEDQLLSKRINTLQEQQSHVLLDRYEETLAQLKTINTTMNSVNLSGAIEGCVRDIRTDASNAFQLFESDLARSAMISYRGVCDLSWDTHADHITQIENQRDFYWYLHDIMTDLTTRESIRGIPLIDEVVVVVFSEMGRAPRFNSFGGRDHWTFTSAMLMGAGVRGNQAIGALNNYGHGQPVVLDSGELHSSGQMLLPQHLGATLLALGNVDPGVHLDSGFQPITSAIL
jgi:hypothetical protein